MKTKAGETQSPIRVHEGLEEVSVQFSIWCAFVGCCKMINTQFSWKQSNVQNFSASKHHIDELRCLLVSRDILMLTDVSPTSTEHYVKHLKCKKSLTAAPRKTFNRFMNRCRLTWRSFLEKIWNIRVRTGVLMEEAGQEEFSWCSCGTKTFSSFFTSEDLVCKKTVATKVFFTKKLQTEAKQS